jgi:hypothetical protein
VIRREGVIDHVRAPLDTPLSVDDLAGGFVQAGMCDAGRRPPGDLSRYSTGRRAAGGHP